MGARETVPLFFLYLNTSMNNLSLPTDTFNLFPSDPTSHVVQFSRMPMTTYVVQEVNLPSVTARNITLGTPNINVHHLADRLSYDSLQISFLLDEEFKAWRELYSWLLGTTGGYDRSVLVAEFIDQNINFVQQDPPNRRLDRAARTTAGLTIVNGAKIPILRFMFHNVYISSLGQVQFSTTTTDTLTPLTCTATFEYDYYSLVELRR